MNNSTGPAENATDAKKKITEAVKRTSEKLGNPPAVSRAYYIHPAIPEAFTDGVLLEASNRAKNSGVGDKGLRPEERTARALVRPYISLTVPAKKTA